MLLRKRANEEAMQMPDSQGKITLIVGAPLERLSAHQSTIGSAVEISADDLRNNIDNCLQQMKQVFSSLREPAIDGWSVQNISVGLTISAEGSIGIATAGVEASINISFSPIK